MGKKLTLELFQRIARNKQGECLSPEYINNATKMLWRCKNGHIFEMYPTHVKDRGSWCRRCFKGDMRPLVGLADRRGGKCLSKKYQGSKFKYHWQCSEGHTWKALYHNIKKGHWCPYCSASYLETICRSFFERLFKAPFPTKRPSWLVNKKGNRLELDGYNEELGIAFEHQGPHHYQDHFYNFANHSTILEHDIIKSKECSKRDISLIVIPCLYDKLPIKDFKKHIKRELNKAQVIIPNEFSSIEILHESLYTSKSDSLAELLKPKGISIGVYISEHKPITCICDECGYTWTTRPYRLRKRKIGCIKCTEYRK